MVPKIGDCQSHLYVFVLKQLFSSQEGSQGDFSKCHRRIICVRDSKPCLKHCVPAWTFRKGSGLGDKIQDLLKHYSALEKLRGKGVGRHRWPSR